jgi:molybdopterin/thiamine biosynthesis adenylyltransferase
MKKKNKRSRHFHSKFDKASNIKIGGFIKFRIGNLRELRTRLLRDISNEHYAVLLGKYERFGEYEQINVYDLRFLDQTDYKDQSMSFLRLKKEFIHSILIELTNRYDVDSIVDVHTHPFSEKHVCFSPVDDNDEINFFRFLNENFDGLHYGSIVLSQTEYSARIWHLNNGKSNPRYTIIKTQTKHEEINSSDFYQKSVTNFTKEYQEIFHRSSLTLGLDVIRKIMNKQIISVVGVGGLGSIIAEHLIHMGFHNINLIDHDILEISNLNRMVGATFEDASKKAFKVDVVKHHLERINPNCKILAIANDIHDEGNDKVIALSDWIILATDNHSSRFRVQKLSVKYFIPIISVGVNITTQNGKIKDMSGEVITLRIGDNLCLNCLGRINPTQVANETHPDQNIRNELLKRGYVTGSQIKEPAVKTLNSILATLAVDILINQYTERQKHTPILVYEDNINKTIYEDIDSLKTRNKNCFTCNI